MSSSNFLPFTIQENAHIQQRFQRRQALGTSMITFDLFRAYQNPCSSLLLSAPPSRGSLNGNSRFPGVRHINNNNPMIQKLHQLHVWMRMARRFGIRANRAASRAPYFRSRVMVITRRLPAVNHRVDDSANFASFQANYSTPMEGSGVEIHDGHKEEKFEDIEEQKDELDLRLKL